MNSTSRKIWRLRQEEGRKRLFGPGYTHGIHLYVYFTSTEENNLFCLLIKPREQSKKLAPCAREIKYELKFSAPFFMALTRQVRNWWCTMKSGTLFLYTILSYLFLKAPEAIIHFILLAVASRSLLSCHFTKLAALLSLTDSTLERSQSQIKFTDNKSRVRCVGLWPSQHKYNLICISCFMQ